MADLEARLRADGLDPGSWSNGPHDRYAAHEHAYDKVLACAAGSIRFGLPEIGEVVELRPGDRLDLPAGPATTRSLARSGSPASRRTCRRGGSERWSDALPGAGSERSGRRTPRKSVAARPAVRDIAPASIRAPNRNGPRFVTGGRPDEARTARQRRQVSSL